MAAIEVKKREGESSGSLIYRFTKRAQHSGVIKEAKKRRFHSRPVSRLRRRLSAIHRFKKREAFEKIKKLGLA